MRITLMDRLVFWWKARCDHPVVLHQVKLVQNPNVRDHWLIKCKRCRSVLHVGHYLPEQYVAHEDPND